VALIAIDDLNERLGRTLSGDEETQALRYIDDASAIVLSIANPTTDWTSATLPAVVLPVIVAMVRRGMENPRGLTGEQIGSYSWQAGASTPSTLYATPEEKRIIRRAASTLGVGTALLEGYVPDRTAGLDFEDQFIDSIYESADA
jgi:hypothetical protein